MTGRESFMDRPHVGSESKRRKSSRYLGNSGNKRRGVSLADELEEQRVSESSEEGAEVNTALRRLNEIMAEATSSQRRELVVEKLKAFPGHFLRTFYSAEEIANMDGFEGRLQRREAKLGVFKGLIEPLFQKALAQLSANPSLENRDTMAALHKLAMMTAPSHQEIRKSLQDLQKIYGHEQSTLTVKHVSEKDLDEQLADLATIPAEVKYDDVEAADDVVEGGAEEEGGS